MFDFLKKKISGWMGKEEPKKAKAKTSKKAPKEKKEKKKEIQEVKKISKKEGKPEISKPEKTQEKEEKEILRLEEKEEVQAGEDKKEDKSGFFSKLFKKKEKRGEEKFEEKKEEKKEEIFKELKKAEKIEEDKEEPEEESKEEVPKEEGFFRKLVGKMSTSQLTQEQFDEIFMELELTLLESNVALEAVDRIKENLSKKLVGQQMKKADAEKKVISSLKESILDLLIEPPDLFKMIKEKEGIFTVLFFGINGTGKTTSIAKLAHLLKEKGIPCVLAAGDTFRAASIEQLKTHGDRIGVPVISSNYGADPASVAFEAKKYAEAHGIKVILIDTAGRMYTKENLLKEMEKIVRVSKPDLKIFVGESITGNDAVEQARSFNESAGIDGIILSKADIDEKAGAILSVSHVTGKPIYFLGTGQDYEDLEVFSKKIVLKNLGLE